MYCELTYRHTYTRWFDSPVKIIAQATGRVGTLDNIQKWLDFKHQKEQIPGIKSGPTCIISVGPGLFSQREEARLTIVTVLHAHWLSREDINLEIMNIPLMGRSIQKEDGR